MHVLARFGDRELSYQGLLDHPKLDGRVRRMLKGRAESLPAFLERHRRHERRRDRAREIAEEEGFEDRPPGTPGVTPPLELADRKRLVDQARLLFQRTYAHLPFKRSFYGVDPVQRLRLLELRLDFLGKDIVDESADENVSAAVARELSDLDFHREMIDIFTSVRDLHTLYMLPAPFRTCLAFLPFTVKEYFDLEDPDGRRPRYMVADVMKGVGDVLSAALDTSFAPGVEVLYWNGVPVRRAVEVIAEKNSAGSNAAARRVRALDRCTFRPLALAMPPDEHWVDVRYRVADGADVESIVFYWQAYRPSDEDRRRALILAAFREAARRVVGREGGAEAPRKTLALGAGARDALVARLSRAAGERRPPAPPPDPTDTGGRGDGFDLEVELRRELRNALFERPRTAEEIIEKRIPTVMPEIFEAFSVRPLPDRPPVGLIRIYTFAVGETDADVDDFVTRFAEVLDHADLPRDGLIVDVRGNGGGRIPAGERLLQLLTPRTIVPATFEFCNTPLNFEFLRRHTELAKREGRQAKFEDWMSSIKSSIATGEIYSRGFPVTPAERCNDVGQRYHGPVVLLIDAKCYSTTDVFIAGFRDHEIGKIVAVHENTGAGGASVTSHKILSEVFGKTEDPESESGASPFLPLPAGAEMQVALRRSIRVLQAAGRPLENLGVRPDVVLPLSRRDVLHGAGYDIYERVTRLLAEQPAKSLRYEVVRDRGGRAFLAVAGQGFCHCTVSISNTVPLPSERGNPPGISADGQSIVPPHPSFDCRYFFSIEGNLDQFSGEELIVKGLYSPEEWIELMQIRRGVKQEHVTPLDRQPIACQRIKVDDILAQLR